MENILEQIANCVDKGKINRSVPYPREMKGHRVWTTYLQHWS
jgi:hypothetical protein